jgi:hypothetical protein
VIRFFGILKSLGSSGDLGFATIGRGAVASSADLRNIRPISDEFPDFDPDLRKGCCAGPVRNRPSLGYMIHSHLEAK